MNKHCYSLDPFVPFTVGLARCGVEQGHNHDKGGRVPVYRIRRSDTSGLLGPSSDLCTAAVNINHERRRQITENAEHYSTYRPLVEGRDEIARRQ